MSKSHRGGGGLPACSSWLTDRNCACFIGRLFPLLLLNDQTTNLDAPTRTPPPQLIAMSPNGVKCAGAMTRDVAVYCVSIASVLLAFAIGTVSFPGGC